jgi:hypothetical protein
VTARKFGSVRPGTIFVYDGKRYMKQRGSFATSMDGGLFSDGVHLHRSTTVEIEDTSMALTREQLRET